MHLKSCCENCCASSFSPFSSYSFPWPTVSCSWMSSGFFSRFTSGLSFSPVTFTSSAVSTGLKGSYPTSSQPPTNVSSAGQSLSSTRSLVGLFSSEKKNSKPTHFSICIKSQCKLPCPSFFTQHEPHLCLLVPS